MDRCYSLNPDDLRTVTAAFGVAFDPGGRDVVLAPWHPIRDAPYLVHTGFELALMLEGRKPLAAFSSTDPCEWLDDLMRRFDPFVARGRFVSGARWRLRCRSPGARPAAVSWTTSKRSTWPSAGRSGA